MFMDTSDGNSACVYLFQEDGTDYHKVGITRKNPEKRARALQCGNPRSIKYICRTPYMPYELAIEVERDLIQCITYKGRWDEKKVRIIYSYEQVVADKKIKGGTEWIEYPSHKLRRIFSKINAVCRTNTKTTTLWWPTAVTTSTTRET